MTTTYAKEPFEHWVLDDFLPQDIAWEAYTHFYDGDGPWTQRNHLYCRNKETRVAGLHDRVERVLQTLEGPAIRHYLSRLTEIPGLENDPDRFGGGQHVIRQGGFLGIHADFTHHPTTGKRRAVNLLLYLNANWRKEYGGELELWAPDMSRCVVKVEPLFNRAVVFKTGLTSYHGHPEPLETAERRSLAVYYYLPYIASDYANIYGGLFNDWLRTTDYRPRPWEYGLRARRWLSRLMKG